MDGDDDHANAHTAQETVAVALGLYSVPYQSNCEQNTFDEQFGTAVSQYIPTHRTLCSRGEKTCSGLMTYSHISARELMSILQ